MQYHIKLNMILYCYVMNGVHSHSLTRGMYCNEKSFLAAV